MGRTGPANLPGGVRVMSARRPGRSAAPSPSVRPALAGPPQQRGRIPNGAAGGQATATSPMARAPRTVINRPKTTGRRGGSINLNPRADGPSRI